MKVDESFVDEEFTYNDIGSVNDSSLLSFFQNSVIRGKKRFLNEKQRQVFERIHKWSRDYFKSLPNKTPQKINQFHIFLTGAAGVSKSHLIKTIP